jgi:hypothetical protein
MFPDGATDVPVNRQDVENGFNLIAADGEILVRIKFPPRAGPGVTASFNLTAIARHNLTAVTRFFGTEPPKSWRDQPPML